MRLLLTHLGESSSLELGDGHFILGGAPGDHVCFSPLPPGFLSLTVEGPHLTLQAKAPFTIDGVAFPGDEPRELLRGEVATLPGGVLLSQAPRIDATVGPQQTRALFLEMLKEPHRP